MRRSKLWIVIVLLLVMVIAVVGLGAGFYYLISRPPSIQEGTVVEVTLSGVLAELPVTDPLTLLLGSKGQNLWDLREVFRSASEDTRVAAIYLEIRPLLASWAQIEEVREFIKAFQKSGKQVHAFLSVDMATEKELYLVAAADSITLNPTSGVLIDGLMAELVFMKRTMEKLRIRPEFIQFKEYKNPEIYSRQSMTPEFEEMLVAILSDLQNRFIQTVGADRKLEETRLRGLLDVGIVSARKAMEEGLIDDLGYRQQIRDRLKYFQEGEDGYRSVSASDYLETIGFTYLERPQAKVAVVGAVGTIIAGSSEPFSGLMGGSTVAGHLREIREDDSFDAVILRVDSPGGSAVGSDMIWKEVRLLEESGKPVIVSMSGTAGSGGYYIAMGASRIVCQPSTITGSIGVLFGKFDVSGLYEWLGMDIDRVKLAPNADLFSLYHSFTPEQRQQIETLMGEIYDSFVGKAAQGRNTSYEELEAKAHGRIYTGSQATGNGLADELGGFSAAATAVREALAIGPDDPISQLFPKPKSFWESLASSELFELEAGSRLIPLLAKELQLLENPSVWLLAPDVRIH
jgi:protease-4